MSSVLRLTAFLIVIYTLLNACQMPQQDATYTKLQENIYEINNQYFYGSKVHTYLIDLPDKILLFDIPTYSEEVKAFIESFNKPAYAIISHGSYGIEDGTKWQKEIGLKVYAHKADETHPWIRMKPDVLFTEMPEFDSSIKVIHTPGHSAGSICVLETHSKSLFTGDTFYGNKAGKIRDFTQEQQSHYENLENRIQSCKNLLAYEFKNVYPFHYEIILKDGKVKLNDFLKKK